MKITYTPVRCETRLTLQRAGDVLWINAEPFDFGELAEGCEIAPEDTGSEWIVGPVSRVNGQLHIALIVPHGPNAPRETLFPATLDPVPEGAVPVPAYEIGPI